MKTVSKKSTITIITLSCLLAVAIASTIILAAFSAVRTSTTTITFAQGLTMSLASKDTSDTIQITQTPDEPANVGTFVYDTESNQYEETVTLDAITATINKEAWVAYQITLNEITGQQTAETAGAVAGAWAQVMTGEEQNQTATNAVVFTPTGTKTNWKATLTVDASKVTVTVLNNVVTVKFNDKWTNTSPSSLAQDLFASIVIDGIPSGNVNDLAGRSLVAKFVIKADTTVVEGENPANPITFS